MWFLSLVTKDLILELLENIIIVCLHENKQFDFGKLILVGKEFHCQINLK